MTNKLIVFDWDGTLMDSQARIVACMKAAIKDIELPELSVVEISNVIGLGLREAVISLFPDATEAEFSSLVERYRYHFLVGDKTPSPLFSGAKELLEQLLERDYFLAVATGKGRKGLDRVLEECGMSKLFHATRCADESFSKPHPQMLLDIMEQLGVEPKSTLMVGDTEYDLQMAHNSQARSVAVSYGVHAKPRLLDCQPLACLDSISDLQDWLLQEHWLLPLPN